MQFISLIFIYWKVIYQVDSTTQIFNNWRQIYSIFYLKMTFIVRSVPDYESHLEIFSLVHQKTLIFMD